ncbi:putative reverse transcriptase domain, reverse transcriptase zinc-binding domain protein [Tanacetum coccineum]
MACVTSASYFISINGNIHGFFRGKRGLRQGDPLSPYLFTLVMEVLTMILKRRVLDSNSFRYHKHCEEMDIINLYFTDDLFMFARGDVNSARVIMEALDEFKLTSGFVPSIPKSTTYFCNVSNNVKIDILQILPFSEGQNRIGDWKNKSLSFAGRLQLCKSVLLSMRVYWASVLLIPKVDVALSVASKSSQLKNAWEALRPHGNEILWSRVVWFPHGIPRHAFHIWIVLRGSLRTQDKLRQWDVWHYVRSMDDMDLLPPTLHQIVTHLAPMAKHRTARSVIGRLLLAASAYFIWIERNNRLFKNSRKTPEEIRDCIMVTVRLKLLTFRFKNKAMVSSLLAK